MAAHTVARDANPARIQLGECVENSLGQLLRHVGVHVIPVVVGGFGGVDVEARSGAEVVGIVFAFNVQSAWNSIRNG